MAALPRLKVLRELGPEVGDKPFAVISVRKGLEPGPQACATVPLDDGIDAAEQMQVLRRPDVQPTRMGHENVVVELRRVDVPLTRRGCEPLRPERRLRNIAHGAMGRRIDAGRNLYRQRATVSHAPASVKGDGMRIVAVSPTS